MHSFVVVLPAEPVTPISGLPHSRRTAAPSRCSAWTVSSTSSSGKPAGNRDACCLSTTAATAPFGQRGFNEVVAVKPFALHGEEQVARLQGARVDGVSRRDRFGVEVAGRRA